MARTVSFILLLCLTATQASAVLTARFDLIDNASVFPEGGYITQDMMVTTSTGDDWGTAQVLATLTAGTIYQDPAGSDYAPNPALFPSFPTLEYDSYVDGNGSQPGIAGGAVNLGGNINSTFSDILIDIAWYNTDNDDFGDFRIARFTASDDAVGTWNMLVSSTSGFRSYIGTIENGEFDLRPTGGGEPIPGDLNSDEYVGLDDLDIILGNWNLNVFTGDALQIGDLTLDGLVGLDDLDIILANWGQFVFPGDTSVGDISGDGLVGLDDLDVLLANWGYEILDVDLRADPTSDNYVGLDDLDIVLGHWNEGIPPTLPGDTIPEPAAAAFILAGFAFALSRRDA